MLKITVLGPNEELPQDIKHDSEIIVRFDGQTTYGPLFSVVKNRYGSSNLSMGGHELADILAKHVNG